MDYANITLILIVVLCIYGLYSLNRWIDKEF